MNVDLEIRETIHLLKEVLRKGGITQHQLAVMLDTHPSMVNRWLNGISKPQKLWRREILNHPELRKIAGKR